MSSRWLFPIELHGAGSADIECLPSYLMRAGAALGISPGQIVSHTLDRYLASVRPSEALLPRIEPIPIYLRPNKSTALLVKSLDAGTGIPGFRRGTFLAVSEAIDRCMGAFSRTLKWCPTCFEEFLEQQNNGYYKLIWQVSGVTHCHVHQVPLVDKCPHCYQPQASWRYRRRPIDCVSCKQLLASQHLRVNRDPSMAAISTDIVILVKEIATYSDLSFPSGGVRNLLSALFDELWKQGDDLRMWRRIPRDTYLSIIDGIKPITLETARSIAFRLDMTIPELLHGRLTHTNQALDPSWTENIPTEFKPKRRRKHHDDKKLEAGVLLALKAPEHECKSLKQVAADIHVSEGCLRHRFPSASEEIIKRFRQRTKAEEMKLRIKVRAAVTGYLASKPISSKSPHGIVTTIWRETGLPRERIRGAVEEILHSTRPTGRAPRKFTAIKRVYQRRHE